MINPDLLRTFLQVLPSIVAAGAALGAWLSVSRSALLTREADLERHRRDRSVLAASLLGELSAYTELADSYALFSNLQTLVNTPPENFRDALAGLYEPPTTFPVFDRCAEKIGLLPGNLPRDLAALYNAIQSIRIMTAHLSKPAFYNSAKSSIKLHLQALSGMVTLASTTYERVRPALEMTADLRAS